MCGIFGVVSKNDKRLDLSACKRALNKLNWRGPDLTTSTFWKDNVFIGQSILSITGNIKDGKHLHSHSGRFTLAFNGEIYNYEELHKKYLNNKFSSKLQITDSEILVNLFENNSLKDILCLLDGMYGILLLDKREETITISRDIQGEKSIYIFEDNELVVFSSEISPILDFIPSIKIDKQSLRDYFHTRHMMQFERTNYIGILQIPPGNTRTLNLKSFKWLNSYQLKMSDLINPNKMQSFSERSEESLLDELESIFIKCVKEMIPHRSFASVLSGGIDSSLISALLLKYGNPEMLIAINHIGKDMISNDLIGFEKHLGQKVNVIDVDLASYAAEIERCQKACGGPIFSHSFIGQSIQSSHVRAAGCRVLFGGEGADELFGGYSSYLNNRDKIGKFSNSPYTSFNNTQLNFFNSDTKYIKNILVDAWSSAINSYQHLPDTNEKVAQAMMYCDLAFQVPSVGLRGADLMSMMWSVETRSIFLRKSIIEFALNLPVRLKSNVDQPNPLLQSKYLLKKLFLRYYPEELLINKQGFSGFPNESATYLGEIEDFLVFDFLGISKDILKKQDLSRDTEWKLINLEYFLRYSIQ